MIVRILGEGQLELPEEHLTELNELDADLAAAVTSGDERGFEQALTALLERLRALSAALPEDHLGASDLILPGPDSTLVEVAALLTEDGLIPG